MIAKRFIYGCSGVIKRFVKADEVEVEFTVEGNTQKALLKQDKFYYNAKTLPRTERLHSYLNIGMEINFSCKKMSFTSNHPYDWVVTMCWQKDQKPGVCVEVSIGMVHSIAHILHIGEHDGILLMSDVLGKEYKIYFRADKVYINGERLPPFKSLSDELLINDQVFFDAIPCISNENEHKCKWFATCVFKGKKPGVMIDDSIEENKELDGSHRLLQTIKNYSSNPRAVFISGKGTIINILSDDFGIILGEFQYNIHQVILFHKRNAYINKMPLADAKLTEVLSEGDLMTFVAVGAPTGFITEWIAVQVAVCDENEYSFPTFSKYCPVRPKTVHNVGLC